MELANNFVIFHKGTRDNLNIDVYKDLIRSSLYKDYFISEEEYIEGEYRKEVAKKANYDLTVKDFMRVNDCARRVKENSPFYIGKDITDFGCGYGDFLKETKEFTKSSVGIELQIDCIKELNNFGIRCENSLDMLKIIVLTPFSFFIHLNICPNLSKY